jgi:elongation factor Ts
MEISAILIKEVKEKTGAGVVDCKLTLQETNGDVAKAVDILKKKGLGKADKKAGREAKEGSVVYECVKDKGLILKVNCETDFVAQTEDFKKFVNQVKEVLFKKEYPFSPKLPDDVEELRRNVIAKLGENILVSEWRFIKQGKELFPYLHLGKVGVIVDFDAGKITEDVKQMMKNIAMQITAMNPVAVDNNSIPPDKLTELKNTFAEEAKATGKPAKIIENIVKGKLDKYKNENILLEQFYILDEEKKVGQVLEEFIKEKGVPLKVNSFIRVSL